MRCLWWCGRWWTARLFTWRTECGCMSARNTMQETINLARSAKSTKCMSSLWSDPGPHSSTMVPLPPHLGRGCVNRMCESNREFQSLNRHRHFHVAAPSHPPRPPTAAPPTTRAAAPAPPPTLPSHQQRTCTNHQGLLPLNHHKARHQRPPTGRIFPLPEEESSLPPEEESSPSDRAGAPADLAAAPALVAPGPLAGRTRLRRPDPLVVPRDVPAPPPPR